MTNYAKGIHSLDFAPLSDSVGMENPKISILRFIDALGRLIPGSDGSKSFPEPRVELVGLLDLTLFLTRLRNSSFS